MAKQRGGAIECHETKCVYHVWHDSFENGPYCQLEECVKKDSKMSNPTIFDFDQEEK